MKLETKLIEYLDCEQQAVQEQPATQVLCSFQYGLSGLLLMGLIGFTFLKVGLSSSQSFVSRKLYNFLLLRFSECEFLMCHN